MRCRYREKIYECGDYIEVNLYPVYRQAHSRRKKSKPTREVQKKLNEIYAENKLIRICNANFTRQDLKVELTYDSKHHPEDDESAAASLRNYLRRLKRYREREGLPELKYISVTEKGKVTRRVDYFDVAISDTAEITVPAVSGSDIKKLSTEGTAAEYKFVPVGIPISIPL